MSSVSIFAVEHIAQTIQKMKDTYSDPLRIIQVPEHVCLAPFELPLIFCLTSSGLSRRSSIISDSPVRRAQITWGTWNVIRWACSGTPVTPCQCLFFRVITEKLLSVLARIMTTSFFSTVATWMTTSTRQQVLPALPCCWSLVAMTAVPAGVGEECSSFSVSWWWDYSVVLWVSFSMRCFCSSFINDLTYQDSTPDSGHHCFTETPEAGENLLSCIMPQRTLGVLQKGGHEKHPWACSPSHKKAKQTPAGLVRYLKSCCFYFFIIFMYFFKKRWQSRSSVSRHEDPGFQHRQRWKAAASGRH